MCHSIDSIEFVDGVRSCDNCGLDLTGLTRAAGEAEVGPIYPVLQRSWAPCQRCGSTTGDFNGPDSDTCEECGQTLLPIFRRPAAEVPASAVAEGAPPSGLDEPGFRVGDVCVGSGQRLLVGSGPLTEMHVAQVHPNGLLDVVAVNDGTLWVGVPREAVYRLGCNAPPGAPPRCSLTGRARRTNGNFRR